MGSQNDEDRWIAERFSGVSDGYACEVGASNGIALSNTYELEKAGWEVLCIEPNPLYEHELRQARKRVAVAACGKEDAESVPFYVYETIAKVLTPYADKPVALLHHYMSVSSLQPDHRLSKMNPEHPDADHPFSVVRTKVRTLNRLLEETGFPRCDLVSVDTEGTEADVLTGFDPLRWGTSVVIVENNFSEEATREIMRGYGFAMVTRIGVNDIWERQ